MRPIILKINLILFIALALGFSGCSHTMNSAKTPVTSPNTLLPRENKYSREIVELKNVVRRNPNAAETKKAHLELANLYLNHKNPQRNYQEALDHFRAYVATADSSINEETLNWMAALKEIDRLSEEITQVQKELEKSNQAALAFQRTNQKLTREEILLREKNRKLEESNQKLEKTIEMLQNLDQRLEEKRKNFTNQ
jgi:chromosome segregation ATPase